MGSSPTTGTWNKYAVISLYSPEGREFSMKVRNSLGSMKKMQGSQIVRRNGRTLVINKLNPRFKSRQG